MLKIVVLLSNEISTRINYRGIRRNLIQEGVQNKLKDYKFLVSHTCT